MYNYFPHPSNLRQSSACVSLLIQEGWAGYGVYVAILEVLRDAPGFRYNPDPKVWSWVLHGADRELLERVLKQYGLFDLDDDGLLFSPWLNDQLQDYSDKKTKLQEAGRRGAAKRWSAVHANDGQAIATPSEGDGQAIAYNNTQSIFTQPNITSPNNTAGNEWRELLQRGTHKISEEAYLAAAERKDYTGGQAYLLQECYRRGISWEAFQFILERAGAADSTNSTYNTFCALCRRIDSEKYAVKMPDKFFLSKIFG